MDDVPMTPQISVIMSAYNSSDSIERAIQSILDQTFADFELIVLNDGSTDDTEEKILGFTDDRIRYFLLSHSGLPVALNYGISQAKSEIILRHDSDDWSEVNRFELQVQRFVEDPELVILGSWHNVVDENGAYLGMKPTAFDDDALKSMLRRRSPFCHGAVAIRKSALDQLGGYNERLYYSQDYDLWLRMAAAGMKFSCIQKPLYNYSITPDSIAKGWYKLTRAKTIRQNSLIPDRSHNYSLPDLPKISRRRTQSLWNYAVGSLALEDGRRGRALAYFSRSLVNSPLFWQAFVRIGLTLIPKSIAGTIVTGVKNRLESRR